MTWPESKIGEYFDVKHGYAFKGRFFGSEGDYIVVTPGNFHEVGGFRHRGTKEKYYSQTPPDEYVMSQGDLIIAMTEQGEGLLGSSALIPSDETYLHNQRIGLVVNLDQSNLDRRFLYYLLNTRDVRMQIRATATGTKVKHTAPSRIRAVTAKLPPVDVQVRIAEILAAYDELIENNSRRMALLEEAIHMVFREWFIYLHFPGHERVNIVDGLPQGWTRLTVGEAFSYVGGGTPSRKVEEYWHPGTIDWYSPTDLTKSGTLFMEGSKERISEIGLAKSSAKIFEPYCVMMSSRATIGLIAINTTPASTNQGFITCIPSETIQLHFLYCWLVANTETFIGQSTGSTFKELSKRVFAQIALLAPPKALAAEFESHASYYSRQILCLQRQNERLREARDLLIPRLMNGSIAV